MGSNYEVDDPKNLFVNIIIIICEILIVLAVLNQRKKKLENLSLYLKKGIILVSIKTLSFLLVIYKYYISLSNNSTSLMLVFFLNSSSSFFISLYFLVLYCTIFCVGMNDNPEKIKAGRVLALSLFLSTCFFPLAFKNHISVDQFIIVATIISLINLVVGVKIFVQILNIIHLKESTKKLSFVEISKRYT